MSNEANCRVAVSGLGMLCSLGKTVDECWGNLITGKSGVISTSQKFGEQFPVRVYAPVEKNERYGKYGIERAFGFLEEVITQAILQAELPASKVSDCQLVVAICPFDQTWDARVRQLVGLSSPQEIFDKIDTCHTDIIDQTAIVKLLADIMERFNLKKFPIMLHTACSSGNSAIQFALEAIQCKDAEVAIVAGVEISTSAEALIRFNLLGTLATPEIMPQDAARPFSKNRQGFVLGEGAAAMILENEEKCGNTGLGIVAGAGESMDTFHRTRSDPEATAAIKAVHAALRDSELIPEDIDYVNAHGTGTIENDRTEAKCINLVFGKNDKNIPVTSNKSCMGHTLSTAGVIEAIFCIKSLQTSIIPPTLNYNIPDPEIALNIVTEAMTMPNLKNVISNSFGFGGQNVCVVFSK